MQAFLVCVSTFYEFGIAVGQQMAIILECSDTMLTRLRERPCCGQKNARTRRA
jgi:hypothetical protein